MSSEKSDAAGVHELIDELAELRGLFEKLSTPGSDEVTFESVLNLCKECNKEVSESVLGEIWSGINHGSGTQPIDFDHFLQFLSFTEAGNSRTATAANIAASLQAKSAESQPPVADVRSLLTQHLRTRPDFDEVKSQGIIRTSTSKLQKEFAKDTLKRTLARRPSMEQLEKSGIAHPLTPQQIQLQRLLIEDHLKRALGTRPDIEDLEKRGIVIRCQTSNSTHSFTTASLLELERNLNKVRLKHALESPNRPDPEQLQAQGIYLDQTPQQHKMERNLAKSQLHHRLSSKPDLTELVEKGIYEGQDSA